MTARCDFEDGGWRMLPGDQVGYGCQGNRHGGGCGFGWHLLLGWNGGPRPGNCDGQPEHSDASEPPPIGLYLDTYLDTEVAP